MDGVAKQLGALVIGSPGKCSKNETGWYSKKRDGFQWKNDGKYSIKFRLIDWFDFILWILPTCIRFNGWMNGWSDSKTVVKAFARGRDA